MSPTNTALLRFLTHLAMYLGGCESANQTAALFNPVLREAKVLQQLMDHLLTDLEVLMKAFNKSPDDVCLLVNVLLYRMWQHDQGTGVTTSSNF